MELSLFSYHQNSFSLLHKPFFSLPISGKRVPKRDPFLLQCHCTLSSSSNDDDNIKAATVSLQHEGRRVVLGSLLTAAAAMYISDVAEAASTSRRALRGAKIPETEFTTLPNGLKYYDLKVGSGLKAVKGSRVAVHYVAKWRGVTFMTSRQGLGVGGGTLAYGKKGVQEIPPNATIE
ncbi:hypothetical protein Gotur_031756, partial [Gossypium turneri]